MDGEIFSIAENQIVQENLFVLSEDKKLLRIQISDFSIFDAFNLPETKLDFTRPIVIKVSLSEKFCVIANKYNQNGIVIDLEKNEIILELKRDDYHVKYCSFTLAFFKFENQEYLIHGTEWNRLDITNLDSRKLITERKSPEYTEPNYLDYFHSEISVSPNFERIVDNGWVWHPYGVLKSWSLPEWLKNVWESEVGESRFDITSAAYFWDRPLCWISNDIIAYWGVGDDDEEMEDSVVLFDLVKRESIKVIKGIPKSPLFFDKYLFCYGFGKGLNIWSIENSELMYSNGKLNVKTLIKCRNRYISNIFGSKIEFIQLKN